jgi:outer membrane protein OmpA-like peptidoglycan-associated protein
VKGLSGETGKKLVHAFAGLIASGFKPSTDKANDSQIVRAFFAREIVGIMEQGSLTPIPLPKMKERVVFGIDQASLTPEAYATIGRVRDFAATNTNSIILLTGNADTLGSARRNRELARRRSAVVREELVSAGGIASNRVFSVDLGNDSLPAVTPPNTADTQNRAVSIEVRE